MTQMRGNFRGSGIVGAVEWFVGRYGPAAAQVAFTKMPPELRSQLLPHHPTLGIFGGRFYSYAFVGELLRQLGAAIKVRDEDTFIREVTAAGMDASLSTVNRVALMHFMSYEAYVARSQQVWDMYHDAGTLKILVAAPKELQVEILDWPAHDVTVCKICLYARRRILEKMGFDVVASRREKCRANGDASCVTLYRWA